MEDYAIWMVLAVLLLAGVGVRRAERLQATPPPRPTGIEPVVIDRAQVSRTTPSTG